MERVAGSSVESYDRTFGHLAPDIESLVEVASGFRWAEGPVWFADLGCLLFSDIPNDRMLRFTPEGPRGGATTVFREPSNYANGHTRDREGRLVSCEHGGRRVTRTEADGRITVLADRHLGRRLNSPNDVVVAQDGAVWFTDPSYGIMSDYEGHRAEPEQDGRYVFRFDPSSGALTVAADDFAQPNGLCFSPDGRTLYVADSGASHDPDAPHHVRAFDVSAEGRLSNGRVLAEIAPGVPDGLRADADGRLWVSCGDGVICLDPSGAALGKIRTPQVVANVTFGGPRRTRLYITATRSLYSFELTVAGAQRP